MTNSAFPHGERKTQATLLEERHEIARRGAATLQAGVFNTGEVRRSEGLGASGNVPTMLILSPAAERRQKAARAAEAAAAEARAREEAAAAVRRAAAAKAKAEADARAAEVARKAAEAKRFADGEIARRAHEARKAAAAKASQRVVVVKADIPNSALSATARGVFAYLVVKYTDAGKRPVKAVAADVASALGIGEKAARDALDGLKLLGWVVEVTDSYSAKKLMPAAHAAATVEVEAA